MKGLDGKEKEVMGMDENTRYYIGRQELMNTNREDWIGEHERILVGIISFG